MPRALADLQPGQCGYVSNVAGEPAIRHRLLEMGLTRGTEVRMVRTAPLGDPIEYHLRGYRLSVRRSDAAAITVEADR